MRTALPTVKKLEEFETITLTGKTPIGGGTGIPISGGGAVAKVEVRSAYEKMKDAMIPVEKGKTYEFTLTAIAGGAVWQNTVTKTVVAGESTLSFSLSLLSIGATSCYAGYVNYLPVGNYVLVFTLYGVASGTKITVVKKGSAGDVYVQADWAESGIHESEDGVFYIGCDSTAKSEENIAW